MAKNSREAYIRASTVTALKVIGSGIIMIILLSVIFLQGIV